MICPLCWKFLIDFDTQLPLLISYQTNILSDIKWLQLDYHYLITRMHCFPNPISYDSKEEAIRQCW